MSELDSDPVNSPSHYASGAVECIDAIQASMTAEQFVGYCKGNCMKYIWRFDQKGKAKEDLEKAAWYLDRLQRSVAIRDAVKVAKTAFYRLADLVHGGHRWRRLLPGEAIEDGDIYESSSGNLCEFKFLVGREIGESPVGYRRMDE